MSDIIIIGNGPAGISAALYTLRARMSTTIIGRDGGALAKADKIENYYGFPEPVSGSELISSGIAAAKRLGAEILTDEVVSIGYNGLLEVKTKTATLEAPGVILATGSVRSKPSIEGLEAFEGRGVSYCAVCDGFFFRGKDVCVIGEGDYAVNEAAELAPLVKSVTVLTNGLAPTAEIPSGMTVITDKISAVKGGDTVEEVVLESGSSIKTDGVFVAVGVAGSGELARKLGVGMSGRGIAVDENMATGIPGLYAAGDCTAGMLQIAKAVYEGAKAGTEIVKYIRANSA